MARVTAFLRSTLGASLAVALFGLLASLPSAFGVSKMSYAGGATYFVSELAWFILVPALIITKLFGERLRSYGLRLPERPAQAAGLALLVLIPCLALMYAFSLRPEFRAFYALAGVPLPYLLAGFLLILPASFFAEEFLFRGFFLFTLERRGRVLAIVVNALLFGLLHFAKPALEVPFAALSAVALSWLTLKTGSVLPAAAVHFLFAAALFAFVALPLP